MKSNWNYPTTMWVGKDRIKDLSIACKTLNMKKFYLSHLKGAKNLKKPNHKQSDKPQEFQAFPRQI